MHVYGGSGIYSGSSQYYQPTATSSIHHSRVIVPATSTVHQSHVVAPATSTLHQSHVVVPATNRIYQYRAYDNGYNNQPYTDGQSSYSANAYGNYGNGGQQFNNDQGYGQGNSGYDSSANNGGQVKTRRYQIRRPAIKKEFYDIEEKVIIRPAGSALIELDTPISKTLKQDSYAPGYNGQSQYDAGQSYNRNQHQYQNPNDYNNPGQGYNPNQVVYTPRPVYNPNPNPGQIPLNGQANPRGIQCDHRSRGPNQYQPTTTYLTPTTVTYQPTTPGQYFPTTTYAPTPNSYGSSTPQAPSRTYQPPYNDQNSIQYHPTTFAPTAESSTPRQSVTSSTTNQDVYVSSTTPVSVTIVDTAAASDDNAINRNNNTQRQDIVYARGQSNYGNNQFNGNEENGPDQFRNELPPRGDVSQTADYRQPDQFYHELPRSRYTGPYQPPAVHVETKYNGEPTETNYYAEEITIGNRGQNASRNRNNSTDQQQRLIELYTGNGGVTEIGQTGDQQQQQQQQPQNGRYTNDGSSSYNDVGNVRARVISATPAPEGSQPSEHVNTRRIVVSKRVETVQEIEVPENNGTASANNGQGANANYNDNSNWNNGQQQRYNDDNSNYNSNSNSNYNSDGRFANYNDGRSSSNYENSAEYNDSGNGNSQENYANGGSSESSARYSTPSTPSGYYISATPASTGKRVIYVKPVSQEFAEQKAVPPAQSSNQRRV